MSGAELHFRKIEVRRMPGFPPGQGFAVDDLCPGVNIVYGPNASGKTTLSRAIQTLLRPQDGPKPEHVLRAAVEVRGEPWTIDYDVGKAECQRGGAEAECPLLAPADVGDHYVLALHDLIGAADGRDLAARIVRESAGGYDVAEARGQLGFRDRPSGRAKAKELDAALAARREAEKRQDALVERERELAELRARQAGARAAEDRLRWIERAIALCDARDRRRLASGQLEAFPPALAAMTGDEVARLEKLNKSLRAAAEEKRREESLLRAAEDRLAACGLPAEGVAAERVGALRRQCQRLQALATQIAGARQEAEKAAAQVAQAREALGGSAPAAADPPGRLDAAAVARLAELARRVERVRAEIAAAESLREWLGPEAAPGDSAAPPDALRQGAAILDRWLAVDEAAGVAGVGLASRRKSLLLGAAAVVAVAGALMAVLVHGSWIALLAVAAGLAAWALVPAASIDRRGQLQRDFEGQVLGQPAAWRASEVAAMAGQLRRRADDAELRRERAARWGNLEARRQQAARLREETEAAKRGLAEQLGLGLETAEADENWLSVLGAGILRVHEAEESLAGATAVLHAAQAEAQSLARQLTTALREYGFAETDDPDLLAEQVEALALRQQEHEAARAEAAARQRDIGRIEAGAGRARDERDALLTRLGLTPDGEPTLHQYAAMFAEYRAASESARFAERDFQAAEAALAGHEELAGAAREELEAERSRCAALGAELQSLTRTIGEIEGSIKEAKRRTDLEAALAREAECREALREQREQDYGAVAGHVLAGFLARHERDRQRPGVFQDARGLFVHITHGRYRLDIDPGDPPGFRALDTHREEGLTLDQLSSGTRLQLLLAVRVAFVQRQEQGLKLPLVLDETLGNSDERRAEQIIDAAIQICRAGRQVFYLTAQHDEVGKWQAILQRYPDVPSRVIDLAEVRHFSQAERVPPARFTVPPPPEVPAPGGLDWLAYGRLLDVPPFDPGAEPGGVHLWYLIDDPAAIHRLLRQGINLWGQFQALAQYGRDPSLRADSPLFRRAEAAARVLQAAARQWRVGRGRPVDRQVLVDCPAVSAAFLDRVAGLAAESGGDARRLVAALEAGQAKGFRANKLAELREYLVEQGCLDEREPLGLDEIRDRVRPLAFADLEAGLLTLERFETLLAVVAGGGP